MQSVVCTLARERKCECRMRRRRAFQSQRAQNTITMSCVLRVNLQNFELTCMESIVMRDILMQSWFHSMKLTELFFYLVPLFSVFSSSFLAVDLASNCPIFSSRVTRQQNLHCQPFLLKIKRDMFGVVVNSRLQTITSTK